MKTISYTVSTKYKVIEVTQIRLKVNHSDSELRQALFKKLNILPDEEIKWKIFKCSIDARKKGTIGVRLIYTIHVDAGLNEQSILSLIQS